MEQLHSFMRYVPCMPCPEYSRHWTLSLQENCHVTLNKIWNSFHSLCATGFILAFRTDPSPVKDDTAQLQGFCETLELIFKKGLKSKTI